ncbi:MAG: hypothetical protein HQM10_24015 [Candidatus Riflebacteria bacterium]|nr:hypothetical protein [Candidatus Riflebacteria bacterium]
MQKIVPAFLILFEFFFCFCRCSAGELNWPIKEHFSIAAHFSDYQNYADIPYWHGGIDLVAPSGTEVFSPVSGEVKIYSYKIDASRNPRKFGYLRTDYGSLSYNEFYKNLDSTEERYIEVSIIDKWKNNWMFRHIAHKTIPAALISLPQSVRRVSSGDLIGKITRWNDTVYPSLQTYHHIHLEIVDKNGVYLNPAKLMKPFLDSEPPLIKKIWITENESENAILSHHAPIPSVKGKIDILAQIEDTNDTGCYITGPYMIKMALSKFQNEKWEYIEQFRDIVKFDVLPVTGDRTKMVEALYKDRVIEKGKTFRSEGNSKLRTAIYNLTNGTPDKGYYPDNSLDTSSLAPGHYCAVIEAYDIGGNISTGTILFKKE